MIQTNTLKYLSIIEQIQSPHFQQDVIHFVYMTCEVKHLERKAFHVYNLSAFLIEKEQNVLNKKVVHSFVENWPHPFRKDRARL